MAHVTLIGAYVFLIRAEQTSPRFEVLQPHIRHQATLADFKRTAAEYQIPIEEERGDGRGLCRVIPLDGSMNGKRLRLRFYDSGELQWAGIITEAGEVEKCLLAVDKR